MDGIDREAQREEMIFKGERRGVKDSHGVGISLEQSSQVDDHRRGNMEYVL